MPMPLIDGKDMGVIIKRNASNRIGRLQIENQGVSKNQ